MADTRRQKADPKYQPAPDREAALAELRRLEGMARRIPMLYLRAFDLAYSGTSDGSFDARAKAGSVSTPTENAATDPNRMGFARDLSEAWARIADGVATIQEGEKLMAEMFGKRRRGFRRGVEDAPDSTVGKDDMKSYREAQGRRQARGEL